MSNEGKKVKVHYKGTLDSGEVFDSSYERNEPIEFVCMAGTVVPGFDNAVRNMEVGEKKTVRLEADEAYGQPNEDLIQTIPLSAIPNSADLPDEGTVYFQTPDGQPVPANIVSKDSENITFDMNHPLAGKALTFELELVDAN